MERQNRTLVSMLRVYCSRYMTDWDRYLPQVMGAYNSTQHSTTGVSPHMMLTGHKYSASTGKAEEKIRQESSWCESLLGGRLRMSISERYTTERNEKAPKKVEGTLHDYGSAPGGTLL